MVNVAEEVEEGLRPEFPGTIRLQKMILPERRFTDIIGRSAALQCILQHIEVAAPSDCSVPMTGGDRNGQGTIWRAIHEHSRT